MAPFKLFFWGIGNVMQYENAESYFVKRKITNLQYRYHFDLSCASTRSKTEYALPCFEKQTKLVSTSLFCLVHC